MWACSLLWLCTLCTLCTLQADTQGTHAPAAADETRAAADGGAVGWVTNASHASSSCNLEVVDARGMSLTALAQRLGRSSTPLLVRNLLTKPRWRAAAAVLGNRSALLQSIGTEHVRLSIGQFLAQGPEKTGADVDNQKLAFMRESWAGGNKPYWAGGAFADSVLRQVKEGEARPIVLLGEYIHALRLGLVPPDAYVFHNVSGSATLSSTVAPLLTLWHKITQAQIADRARAPPGSSAAKIAAGGGVAGGGGGAGQAGAASLDMERTTLTRIGVGGTASGTPFHDHELALNLAFAGRKRWLIAKPATDLVLVGPQDLLYNVLPSAGFQSAWAVMEARGGAWHCTQQPGELIVVPELFLHATVNLEEGLAVAVQCENNDPRTNLTALNALVVHSSEGAASALGPCGTPWSSPWDGLDSEQAIVALHRLLDQHPAEADSVGADGLHPADVAVRWGSVRVATTLAAHGTSFGVGHARAAEDYGHGELAQHLAKSSARRGGKFAEDTLKQTCDVAAPDGCGNKEKKFIEKMSAKDADAIAKEIARLEKMKGGKMKAAQKAFLFQRLNILGQLTKAGLAAKDEL